MDWSTTQARWQNLVRWSSENWFRLVPYALEMHLSTEASPLADRIGIHESIAVDLPVLCKTMRHRPTPADNEDRGVEEHTKDHLRSDG